METEVKAVTEISISDEELLEAVAKARPMVERRLQGSANASYVDDVLQETWLAARRSLDQGKFNPALGKLSSWVARIAQNITFNTFKSSDRSTRLQNRVQGATREFKTVAEDPADRIVARHADHSQALSVLEITGQAMDNYEAYHRTMRLLLEFDEDIKLAASRMSISVDALKASRRETFRVARVVSKALEARRAGEPPTAKNLFECLPDENVSDATGNSGSWAKVIVKAIVVHQLSFQDVKPKHLMAVTGWEHNTCRQYLNQTYDLLSVARTVIEHGVGRLEEH